MGFTVPSPLGAQLAAPKRRVLGVARNGDFVVTLQELATAVQENLPIVYVVLNNSGWQSILNPQTTAYGEKRVVNTWFKLPSGEPCTPKFCEIARGFGAKGWRTDNPEEVGKCVQEALDSGAPSVVEVLTGLTLPMVGLSVRVPRLLSCIPLP